MFPNCAAKGNNITWDVRSRVLVSINGTEYGSMVVYEVVFQIEIEVAPPGWSKRAAVLLAVIFKCVHSFNQAGSNRSLVMWVVPARDCK